MDLFSTAVGALMVVGVLAMIYGVLRFRWPETYLSLADTFGFTLSQSAWRFLAFRGLPVAVTTWAVAVTVERLGGAGTVATLVGVAVHLGATNFRSIWLTMRGRSVVNHVAYHVFMSVVVLVFWALGGVLAAIAPDLVPQPQEFLEDVWLALLIALLGGSFVLTADRVRREGPRSGADYYEWRVRRDVGFELMDFVFAHALAKGKDPFLVTAFVIAEVLQRPKWFRNAERATSWLRSTGTYGVLQVRSKRALTDKESVELGVHSFTDRTALTTAGTHQVFQINNHELWAASANFNGDLVHIETVTEIYEHLTGHGFGRYHLDSSQGPRTAIFGCRLYGAMCGIRGATTASGVRALSIEGIVLFEPGQEDETPGNLAGIKFFELKVPVSEQHILIQETDTLATHRFEIPLSS